MDCGFTWQLLCGTIRFAALPVALTRSAVEVGTVGVVERVRFGGGAAEVVRKLRLRVQIGGVEAEAELWVVKGHLPLLVGSEAGHSLKQMCS